MEAAAVVVPPSTYFKKFAAVIGARAVSIASVMLPSDVSSRTSTSPAFGVCTPAAAAKTAQTAARVHPTRLIPAFLTSYLFSNFWLLNSNLSRRG
jgi:hypothetical protein